MENEATIKNHYTKQELNLFKKPAKRKLKFIKAEIRNLTKEYYAANDHNKKEFYNKLQQTAKLFNGIKRQRRKILDGTFGVCGVTGNLMPKERLMLIFHTWPNIKISDPCPIDSNSNSFSSQLRRWFQSSRN